MAGFLPFFIILITSVLSSAILKKFHLPWVIALIGGGIVIGPYGLDLLEPSPVLDFLSETGLIFLMFMAGLETKFSGVEELRKKVVVLATLNGSIPFFVGLGIGLLFGYSIWAALLIGIVFVSSSIAVVVPTLEATGLMKEKLGKSVIASAVIQDITSMILLSVFLQIHTPTAQIPLYLFYPAIGFFLLILKISLPKITDFFNKYMEESIFQNEVRVLFFVLFGVVILFEILGLHPIVAAFFAGIVLADSVTSDELKTKLQVISYGLFVPAFFIVVGTQIDLGVFMNLGDTGLLLFAICIGSMAAKFLSGAGAGKLVGFESNQALFLGASSIPQLSTTLAATFAAAATGLFTAELITAMIVLSVVSTMVGPIVMNILVDKILSKKDIQTSPVVKSKPGFLGLKK
jgi:Kef-type K+ transport system membrane component KefB